MRDGERASAVEDAVPVRAAGSLRPLFVVHDEEGSVEYAVKLAHHLDARVPLYALPPPESSVVSLRTVEGMAARMVRMIRAVEPGGPYRVAGLGFGGLLAYEIAVQLLGLDEIVDFVGVLVRCSTSGGRPHVAEGGTERHGKQGGRTEGSEWPQSQASFERAAVAYSPQPIPIAVRVFAEELAGPEVSACGWLADLSIHLVRPKGTTTPMETIGRSLGRALVEDALPPSGAPAAPVGGASPIVPLRLGPDDGGILCCVPGAGASVVTFIELVTCLTSDLAVYGLEPRGMMSNAVPHSSVSAAAAFYMKHLSRETLTGPLNLLGHSFGGWVAFEMSRHMMSGEYDLASVLLLDSNPPDDDDANIKEYDSGEAFLKLLEVLTAGRSARHSREDVDALDETGRAKLLHQFLTAEALMAKRSDYEGLRGPMQVFASCLRTSYRPSGQSEYPVHLILVPDQRLDAAANRQRFARIKKGWARWAPKLRLSVLTGGHLSVLKMPHVRGLVDVIEEVAR